MIDYVMHSCVLHTQGESHSTRVKLLGEAAHLLTVVRGHSCTTSFVFSSTRITDSLVMPSSRGTSLFLPFIFSYGNIRQHLCWCRTPTQMIHFKVPVQHCRCCGNRHAVSVFTVAQIEEEEENGCCELTQ